MANHDPIVALCGALALALAGCAPASGGGHSSTTDSTAETSTTTSAGTEDSSPETCTVDADCSEGQTCNCRCSPGQTCDGPADACGDCGQWNMVGICLPGCQGG